MPRRPRTRPSAVRAFFMLAAGLPTIILAAACASVTPTPSAATPGPTAGPPTPPPSPSSALVTASSAPTGSPSPATPGPDIAWRRVAIPGEPAMNTRIAIGPDRIVVAANGESPEGGPSGQVAFWTSTDTVSWVAATQPPAAGDEGIVTAMAASGRGFVAVGTDAIATRPRAWTSPDGRSWSATPEIARGAVGALAAAMTSLAVGSGGELVGGGFADTHDQRLAIAWVSRDGGLSWRSSIVDGSGSRAQVMSVARGGPGWVAAGIRDATAAFWVSRDGLVWVHVVPRPPVGGGFGAESSADGVACSTASCVAVGQGPAAGDGWAWWSDEPGVWNTVPPAEALAGGASHSVVAFEGGFAAGGAGADGRFGIWTSADGRRWAPAPQVAGPVGVVDDLAADGPRVVAVGSPFENGTGFAVWIGSASP